MHCWGRNLYGQLGIGVGGSDRLLPVAVAAPEPMLSVQPGNDHTCGIGVSKQAYCWGLGSSGELGNGTTINHSSPVPVLPMISP